MSTISGDERTELLDKLVEIVLTRFNDAEQIAAVFRISEKEAEGVWNLAMKYYEADTIL